MELPTCEMSKIHLAIEKVDIIASLPPTYDAASHFPGGAVADPFTKEDAKILELREAKVKECEQYYAKQQSQTPTGKDLKFKSYPILRKYK